MTVSCQGPVSFVSPLENSHFATILRHVTRKDDTGETLGEAIRRARDAKGLSQKALAKILGTSRRQVMRWEKDTNRPLAPYRKKLVRALDMDELAFMQLPQTSQAAQERQTLLEVVEDVRGMVAELLARGG